MNTIRVIDINGPDGTVIEPDWLARAETVHRQLRPHLPDGYTAKMQRVFAQGARMCVAAEGDRVVGVAVHRIFENTVDGVQMYVDDLVTDETLRSQGIGKALLDHLQRIARGSLCTKFNLDSGTQRQQAHRFYFREGMVVTSFHFAKPLPAAAA
ncbi:MAG TPA: GNAT family N-acetyltransferase [Rhodanobacteraceae bacterium]|jgi:GNAT superfamily N-acetyltransferase|nr:GNAT family N-acetyltransferase [Rhodanobacteraceae bacterium]